MTMKLMVTTAFKGKASESSGIKKLKHFTSNNPKQDLKIVKDVFIYCRRINFPKEK